ncbi:hypothetical protein BP6252_11160 [Coleophoma cylindrospora]|uniref:Heterokaryon incompatibility domain-containing protein n=1 Tax=Coleophoma cylindrospora TaxID=1849047 RepID=A0A3D8QP83_9HELO|nr:hypothetical protein BP6252_11160 [Coleophoma cylindrospora]
MSASSVQDAIAAVEEGTRAMRLDDKENLCDTCKVLDLKELFFGDENYQFPEQDDFLLGRWNNSFCTYVDHIRTQTCPLCRLMLKSLQRNDKFEKLQDGVVVAFRIRLYSKEIDDYLPNLYFLNLHVAEIDEDGFVRSAEDYGQMLAVQGTQTTRIRNTRKACLRHFYPYLPPGMVPLSTTNDQCAQFDEWREQTGSDYTAHVHPHNPSEVNMELLKGWLRNCEENHKSWCPSKLPFEMESPNLRVIDVVTGNIVWAPANCRYLALSYVWGPPIISNIYLRLLISNSYDLGKPGGLFERLQLLPKTIKDAIVVCQKLNERYLWIDSLCIIQDDALDQKYQITKMDMVYRRALLTIVAASGTAANAGLPGIHPSLPRNKIPTETIQSLNLVAIAQEAEFEANTSTWNSRAWTFQERVLSKRILCFTETSVTFECQESCCREDFELIGPKAGEFRLSNKEREDLERRQNFHAILEDEGSGFNMEFEKMVPREKYTSVFNTLLSVWGGMVEDFTKRDLTYQGDILRAFQGIESALSRSFGSSYWGFPRHLLIQAMSWQAATPDVTAREGFPSWCWAGWVFNNRDNRATYNDQLRGPFPAVILIGEDGGVDYWNREWSKDPYIGIYGWHDEILYPEDGEVAKELDARLTKTIDRLWDQKPDVVFSSLVFFWTSAVPIKLAKPTGTEETEEGQWRDRYTRQLLDGCTVSRKMNVGEAGEGICTNSYLTEEELESARETMKTSELELVYLGSSSISFGMWCLSLVTWVDGTARRVLPHLIFYIEPQKWEAAAPKRKLLVFG